VPDFQLNYLTAQLTKIRDEKYAGAVIIAVHHPPFSYKPKKSVTTGDHGGSPAMLRDIDTICKNVGVYPHAFISGHAHNYQRYTRTVAFAKGQPDYQVPCIVCGNSGHNSSLFVRGDKQHLQDPNDGDDVTYLEDNPAVTSKKLTIEYSDDYNYGHLKATADANQLSVTYTPTGNGGGKQPDTVTVDLATHQLV
jgi:hypothetical protein